MAKQRFSFPFRQVIKQSPKTGLLVAFVWVLYQLFANFQPALNATSMPASDNPVELYSNQTEDDLTDLFTEAIGNAKESITLVIYSLTDKKIIQALNNKSNEDVTVYITCDAKASPGISKNLPHATIVKCFGEGLMHQKILIIDQKLILLGSANFTESSLNVHGNLVMGIVNPALAEALTVRTKSMDDERTVSSPLLHCQATAGSQTIELWVLPDDPTAVKRMIDLIRSAKKSIKVAMYTWTRVDFTKELIAASKRGVKIEAVIDRYSGKGASSKIVKMLEQSGISIRLSQGPGLLHHKFALFDDDILVNGSANWTNAAFNVNDDYFMIVYPLTIIQRDKMNRLWKAIQK